MKYFLWLLVAVIFLSFAIGASSDNNDRNVQAVVNDNKRNPDGSYFYEYFLDNHATQKVTGTLKDVNGVKVYSVEGCYSYRQEDGDFFTVQYIADENGFRVIPDDEANVPLTISHKAIGSLLGG